MYFPFHKATRKGAWKKFKCIQSLIFKQIKLKTKKIFRVGVLLSLYTVFNIIKIKIFSHPEILSSQVIEKENPFMIE